MVCHRSSATRLRIPPGGISAVVGLAVAGCSSPPPDDRSRANASISVETAVAQPGSLEEAICEVSLRAQTEGRLLGLGVDLGDRVTKGQLLGQVDSQLALALVDREQAELAALESEVAQAEVEVSNARTQVEQARAELQQAQADAGRCQSLTGQGAITTQSAEQDTGSLLRPGDEVVKLGDFSAVKEFRCQS